MIRVIVWISSPFYFVTFRVLPPISCYFTVLARMFLTFTPSSTTHKYAYQFTLIVSIINDRH